MAPVVGRAAFTIGIAVLIMGTFAMFYVRPGTPEFVANVLALIIDVVFLGLLIWHIRRAAHLPMQRHLGQQDPTPVSREDEVHGAGS